MKLNFAEEVHVLPLKAPSDIVATATATNYVKIANLGNGQLELAFDFGVVTSTDSTGEVVVTIEANDVNDTSSSDNNEGAIAFNYRLTAAVGTDNMGAITAATATGVAVPNTGDNKLLLCYVDPAVAAKKYVRGVITPTAETTVCIVGAQARFIPRFAQNDAVVST